MVTARVTANSRKETPNDIAHEEKRNEHGDERNSERNDGETDLLGTLEARPEAAIPFLDVTA